ncbi:hypothetical protein B0H16DRAFT_62863 [Mycena metata]|uniref:Cyclin N-terminal domain-containing protein n=1 Tax=Mycena metata TaxID=1033252 RepID=A0AAD7ID15_9AGAR|nr:hypothetical protein B0H16DRAFT_62863 [Mycena metata]
MYADEYSSPASSSSSSASSSAWSSPASTSSTPVHAASLVDPATHAPALLQLIDIKLDKHVIDYVVECVAETVDFAMGRTQPARGRPLSPYVQKFTPFVRTVLSRAEVPFPTVLTALVYIHRARPHLSIALEEWALERVFLGALIVASKYTNDSTLKNVHWALCTGVFGKRDVGRIEREFLDVLDWELGVGEGDLLSHHEGLVAASRRSSALASRISIKAAAPRRTPVLLAPPRPRGHVRRPSVPELEPSSPQSSLASMSPRTPYSQPHGADVPMDVDLSPPHDPRHAHHVRQHHRRTSSGSSSGGVSKGGKLHDLLHSFPMPRSHVAPHAHAHGRGFAIHV